MVKLKLIDREEKKRIVKKKLQFLLTFFGINIIEKLASKNLNKFRNSGEVKITNDSIEFLIKSSIFKTNLKEVEEIKIFSEHYVGHFTRDGDGNQVLSSGILKVQYKVKSEEGKHFNAIIENRKQFEKLKRVLIFWYINQKHLKIKEYPYHDSSRLLLMENLPEYDALQILKKKLGIGSIYS